MHEALIWVISLCSILCVLIRPRGLSEVWWAGGGALLLIVTTLVPLALAGEAVLKGLDVYLFLIGMMTLSEIARKEGVFEWIAEVAALGAKGSPRRLFLLIYLMGVAVTAFLSNDATAVVLTPAVLTIVRRLKVDPLPYLLVCAFVANAAGFILPISNPANLVIFGRHMPPLLQWLSTFLLPSLAAVILTFSILRLVTREKLRGEITEHLVRRGLSANGHVALFGLGVAAFALITASALGWSLGGPTCAAALLVTLVVASRDPSILGTVAREVSWPVIPLVAGLFVIVEALQGAGMLQLALQGLAYASQLGHLGGNLLTSFSAAMISNGMNNLPVGLVGGTAVQEHKELANALLIGIDLGPNLSVTGSLANILWLIALRRERVEITGWQFFKVGLIVMPVSLLGSILMLWK